MVWHWNPQILIAFPQSIALKPQFRILIPQFSILLPQISFIQPTLSIIIFFSSSLNQMYRIFDLKCPQKAWFPTKCPQALLAPLAAFSRSGQDRSSQLITCQIMFEKTLSRRDKWSQCWTGQVFSFWPQIISYTKFSWIQNFFDPKSSNYSNQVAFSRILEILKWYELLKDRVQKSVYSSYHPILSNLKSSYF